MIVVHFSSHFAPYVGAQRRCEISAGNVAELLAALDARCPGLRFRIVDEAGRVRPHVRLFLNGRMLDAPRGDLQPADEVHIMGALSGG